MSIWVLALLLFLSLATAGYYMGALRSAFTFLGLVAGLILAAPLGTVGAALFRIFGLEHPVILAFAGPFAAFVLVLILFKAAGQAVHRQVDTYYKYKASDTVRLLFERMNSRIGAALGLLNGFCYLVALSIVIYGLGYFTVQIRVPGKDVLFLNVLNRLAMDMGATKLDRAVAAFLPGSRKYYDGADILGLLANNPLLQNRLSTYPVFLLLPEKPEFKAIADSKDFQDLWIKNPKPSLQEFRSHEVLRPLVESRETYENFNTMLGGDFSDLLTYLQTGESPMFSEEHILGRWRFNPVATFNLAKRRKPNMSLQEAKRLRVDIAFLKDLSLTATPDGKFAIKVSIPSIPSIPSIRPPGAGAVPVSPVAALANLVKNPGSWERKDGGAYKLTFGQAETSIEARAQVDNDKLTLTPIVPLIKVDSLVLEK